MKQPLNEQFTRMQKLAGIITENQYLKLINEDKFNALDSLAPDWEDSEGYELLLDSYFNSYNLEDPKEFAYEIYENNIDDFNLLIQSIKSNEVPVDKIELVKTRLLKVLIFKPGYLKEILDYYKTWKSESDDLSFISSYIQAKYYLGDEIFKYF